MLGSGRQPLPCLSKALVTLPTSHRARLFDRLGQWPRRFRSSLARLHAPTRHRPPCGAPPQDHGMIWNPAMFHHATTSSKCAGPGFDARPEPSLSTCTSASGRDKSRPVIVRNDMPDVHSRLIDALGARYPVIRRLAGEDSFRTVGCRYLGSEPPTLATSGRFGSTFPHFLRNLGGEPSFEYLADIADLEAAYARACHWPDSIPAEPSATSTHSPDRLGAIGRHLHLSTSLIASRFPVITIWEANQPDRGDTVIRQWNPEAAIIARPYRKVIVRRLPPGGHAFLTSLSAGKTIAQAACAGCASARDFDLTANLALLAESDIANGCQGLA
jgi:hypothetical protein